MSGVSVLGRSAPRLASAFAASPAPFTLFLDDLHELRSPDCHDVLGIVVAKDSRGSQLVAASRSEQPHLPRLRASGDALEFVAGDLALDVVGRPTDLRRVAGHVCPTELAAAVIERTEGWPVGLYLAALLAREGDSESLAVTGDDRYVADYLYRESLTAAARRTCRRSCAVRRRWSRCAVRCATRPRVVRCRCQLRRLEASSLFLVPLDRRRQWYRYHALFREFLLGELRRTEPNMIAKLHLRAADWYESQRSPELALDHLLNTSERARAAQLAAELMLPTYNAGRLSTVQRWLDALGDRAIEEYPPIAVLAGWASVLTGDVAGAQRWAAFVDAASFDSVPIDGTASFDSARAMLRAVMCASGPESMLADATFAVAQESPGSPWRDTALWELAEANLLLGRRRRGTGPVRRIVHVRSHDGQHRLDHQLRSRACLAGHGARRLGGCRRARRAWRWPRSTPNGCTTTSSACWPSPPRPGSPCTNETWTQHASQLEPGDACPPVRHVRRAVHRRSAAVGARQGRTSPSRRPRRPANCFARSTTSWFTARRWATSSTTPRSCALVPPTQPPPRRTRRRSPPPSCASCPTCRHTSPSGRSANVSTFPATPSRPRPSPCTANSEPPRAAMRSSAPTAIGLLGG